MTGPPGLPPTTLDQRPISWIPGILSSTLKHIGRVSCFVALTDMVFYFKGMKHYFIELLNILNDKMKKKNL